MVERCIGSCAGLQERSKQNSAGAITAIALEGEGDAGRDRGGLREGSEIWSGLLVTAELAGRTDQDAGTVGIRAGGESAFIKVDYDEAIVLISL